MSDRVYVGSSLFVNFRKGTHNWLDNNARPLFNLVRTKLSGKRAYTDMFLTDAVEVSETKTHVVIKIPKDISKPIGRFVEKDAS